MAKSEKSPKNRAENILAFMAAGVIGVSILSIFAVIVAAANHANAVIQNLVLLPLIGLPAGALLIIALVVTSAIRRKREQ